MTITPNGRVHPAADLFPMLPDEELAELADDIRANGLREAIKLQDDGTLVDGRNRQRACQMAGIEPRYESLNGTDPAAYILSANVHRRNLTKGQRVLASVLVNFRLDRKIERGAKGRTARELGVDADYVSMAIAVAATDKDGARLYQDLIDRVMSDPNTDPANLSLPQAVQEIQDRQSEAERLAAKEERDARQLAQMAVEAADLADLVAQKKLAFAEAQALWEKRKAERLAQRVDVTESVSRLLVDTLYGIAARDPEQIVADWYPKANRETDRAGADVLWTSEGVRSLAATLGRLADAIDRLKEGRLQ